MERSDRESGTVIESGLVATVVINKSKACHECGKAQAGICGKSGAGMVLKVTNTLNAVKGDMVTLEIEKKTQAKGYFLVFILPVLTLLAGSYAGLLLSQATGIKGLEVITGISLLALAIVYSLIKIHKLDKSADFYISSILTREQNLSLPSCSEETDYLAHFRPRAHI